MFRRRGGPIDRADQPTCRGECPMRRLLPFAFTVLAAAPAAAQPAPSPGALLAQENAVWQAIADHQYDAFAAYLARDYVGVYADGFGTPPRRSPRSGRSISSASRSAISWSAASTRTTSSSPIGSTFPAPHEGHEFAGRYNIASYWHRTGRQWRVQLHSQIQSGPEPALRRSIRRGNPPPPATISCRPAR